MSLGSGPDRYTDTLLLIGGSEAKLPEAERVSIDKNTVLSIVLHVHININLTKYKRKPFWRFNSQTPLPMSLMCSHR
jgi:hypothetical protein